MSSSCLQILTFIVYFTFLIINKMLHVEEQWCLKYTIFSGFPRNTELFSYVWHLSWSAKLIYNWTSDLIRLMHLWLAHPPTSVLLWLLLWGANLFYFIRFDPRGSWLMLSPSESGAGITFFPSTVKMLKTAEIILWALPSLSLTLTNWA